MNCTTCKGPGASKFKDGTRKHMACRLSDKRKKAEANAKRRKKPAKED